MIAVLCVEVIKSARVASGDVKLLGFLRHSLTRFLQETVMQCNVAM